MDIIKSIKQLQKERDDAIFQRHLADKKIADLQQSNDTLHHQLNNRENDILRRNLDFHVANNAACQNEIMNLAAKNERLEAERTRSNKTIEDLEAETEEARHIRSSVVRLAEQSIRLVREKFSGISGQTCGDLGEAFDEIREISDSISWAEVRNKIIEDDEPAKKRRRA